jgi:ubiquinone/menaquinone biosynthesis C-methylase UbiE
MDPTHNHPTTPLTKAETLQHFSQAAATWDDNPHRRELTRAIATAIQSSIPLQPAWRILEYGCGTGSLSLLLAPHVQEVTAADASPGMVDQLRLKLHADPTIPIQPLLLDLTQSPAPAQQFDLIVTAMTLHHIPDVPALLARFSTMLRKGAWLAIADLQKEDGTFHPDFQVPHNGFDPDAFAQTLAHALAAPSAACRTIHHVQKPNRAYPICLWTAQKPEMPAGGRT